MTATSRTRHATLVRMARGRRIELVDEDVDLGGLRVRIARPREPELLLDDAVAEGASEAPYWAELWPSARALAAQLGGLELHGLRAIELGCGLALPSVAAALGGADVLAVDHDAEAVRIARLNGRRTGRRVRGLVADLREPPGELLDADPFDLVLAADVLYDASLAEALGWLIPRLLAPGALALVAFPWRGQADGLARELEAAGLRVQLGELDAPGLLHARTVGLLEARSTNPDLDANATK
jgi:predicted nicotinamide N-methyase